MHPVTVLAALACATLSAPLAAQTALDRAAPDVFTQETPPPPSPDPATPDPVLPAAPAPPAVTGGDAVFVGAIRIVGAERLRPAAFAPVIEPYIGRTLDAGDRQALVDAVTAAARARGYVLATSAIEPQSVGAGVLRVRLDEGRLAAIRLAGRDHPLVARILGRLADGQPVTLDQLERRLLIAGDVAGVGLHDVRVLTEGGVKLLSARVAENRFAGAVSFDNWGTSAIGPFEAQATLEARSVLTAGDEIGLVGAGTPLDPSEYILGGLRYTVPVDDGGTTLDLSGVLARSEPGGRLAGFETTGESASLRGTLRRPLLRRQAHSLWGSLGFGIRELRQDQRGERVRMDRVTSVTARINGTAILPATRVAGSLWLTQGLDLFGATGEGDPLATRRDGSGRFTMIEIRGSVDTVVAGPVVLSLAGETQLASRPLLFSEEMGLGGPRFGRGYDIRERSGDQGVAGSAELRVLAAESLGPLASVSPYAFVDGGHVWNLRGGRGSGGLLSAGAGVRAGIGPAFFNIGLGFPLTDVREETGTRRPRLSFETFLRF